MAGICYFMLSIGSTINLLHAQAGNTSSDLLIAPTGYVYWGSGGIVNFGDVSLGNGWFPDMVNKLAFSGSKCQPVGSSPACPVDKIGNLSLCDTIGPERPEMRFCQ